MKGKTLFLFALLSLAPAAVFAATAEELVHRAQDSDLHVSYRGVKTATVNMGPRTITSVIKVVHLCPAKTRTEYFSPEALAGTIIIQDGSSIWRFLPADDAWTQVRGSSMLPPEVMRQEVTRNYEIQLLGTDHIAGRVAYVLHAIPRRPGDFAHRLWIDKNCYLLIGTQVESPGGTVVNSSRYTSIQIDPRDIEPSIFKVNGKIEPTAVPAQSVSFKLMKPSYIPKGYALVGTAMLNLNGVCFAHLTFSNGANTISLFQRRADAGSHESDVKSKASNVYGWVRSGMQFTLVGQLDGREIHKIANSVR